MTDSKANTTDWITVVDIKGQPVIVRPLKHIDILLEKKFISNLSSETKRNRFLGGVNQLGINELERLCNVDCRDSMAFIATTEISESVVQIGVVRYCKSDSNGKHEMAITIADKYQQTELPSILLKALTAYAKTHDINSLYTVELRDNQNARRLAIEFSMTGMTDPNDAHQKIYTLEL